MVKRVLNVFKGIGIAGGVLFVAFALGTIIYRLSWSSTLTIPNSFSIGQVADPAAVNANFSAISSIVNGGIDDSNWNGAGPKLTCGHFDLTNPCITTTALAADASQSFFNLSAPSNSGSINCTGASAVDITNWTWSPTSSGNPFMVVITGNFANTTNTTDVQLNIGGTIAYTTTLKPGAGGSPSTTFTLVGRSTTSAGVVVIKAQCLNGASGTQFNNGNILALEFKK